MSSAENPENAAVSLNIPTPYRLPPVAVPQRISGRSRTPLRPGRVLSNVGAFLNPGDRSTVTRTPDERCEDETDHPADHQDPADDVHVDTGHAHVKREGQYR